jgi:AcrR family transcriptional regulator
MTEYASRGDARRSMFLLWGKLELGRRGPKQALSVNEIVRAGVELADAEGIEALSMRRVAKALGRSPMALYTYVPGKAELLDLMLDAVLAEVAQGPPVAGGWRAAAEASARQGWAFYERHPWVLHVSGARALLGPHELDAYEAQVRIFDGLGLSAVDQTRVVGVLASFVRGAARAVADARAAERATGVSDDDWWAARSAMLDELVGDWWAERYPTLTRMEAEKAFLQADRAPGDATPYVEYEELAVFEFGLQRLLDGIEAYVAAQAGGSGADAG